MPVVSHVPPVDAAVAAPAEPAPDWLAVSPSMAFELRQTTLAPGSCRVQCTRAASHGVVWSVPSCLATQYQPVFLSDDGESFLVLEPFPIFEEGALLRSELGASYRRGALQRRLPAVEILKDPEKLRRTARHFYWLSGVLDEPGPRPQPAPEGVWLFTLDSQVRVVRFDGTVVDDKTAPRRATSPSAPARPEKAAAAGEEALWRERFRAQHQRVSAARQAVDRARAHLASLEKNGPEPEETPPPPPPSDPSISVPVGTEGDCVVYSKGERVCGVVETQEYALGRANWQAYQNRLRLGRQADKAKKEIAEAQAQLKEAEDELAELERRAGFEGVPFEWRR